MGARHTPPVQYFRKDNQFPDNGFKMASDGYSRNEVLLSWNADNPGTLSHWRLPLVLSVVALASAIVISFLIIIWLKKQMSDKGCEGGDSVQWICHPVIKPSTTPQCDNHPGGGSGGVEMSVESRKDVMRARAKGLLERRGSSASLTIDLMHPSQENITVTPTRECTTEEYLLSVGNLLSRQQLRGSLRDVRALHREFWDLPLNHPDKVHVPGSWAKNRYRTVIPNEVSRVPLQTEICSTDNPVGYINANYIRGYNGEEKAFIATQGPLTHTVVDFWAMVWTERVPVIVMITKLWEKSRSKCELYFPPEPDLPVTFGHFILSVVSIQSKDGYIIRHIHIQKGDETRKVVHFWFDSWPDHKTPPNAHSLLSMAKEVEIARFQGMPQRRLSAAWLSNSPSLKEAASPILTLGSLELKQEESLEQRRYGALSLETPVEAINIEMWKSSEDLRLNTESSPSKKRTRQSDDYDRGGSGGRFFKSPLPRETLAFKFGSTPHVSMPPISPHSRFEIEDRSKSEESDWEYKDLGFTFDFTPKDEDCKNTDSVFWRFEKLSTNSTGSYDTAQSPSWHSLDKSGGGLSVDSPNWTAQTSPNLTGSSDNRSPRTNDSPAFTLSSSGSKRWPSDSKNWTQSSGDSSVWTASEDSPRCWEDVASPRPPVSPVGLLSPRWLDSNNKGSPAGPVVVHCSAGIGRTGCFIAICIGINHLLGENCVDILGIVCRMRYDRGGMVQTAEQYEFIHRALALFERSLPDQSGE